MYIYKYLYRCIYIYINVYIYIQVVISNPRHTEQNAQISQKQDEHNIYAITKTMCPPGYHHNGFVTTHALGHMMKPLW